MLPPADSAWARARAWQRSDPVKYSIAGVRFLLGAVAVVLVGLPVIGAAVAIAAGRTDAFLDGDQAIDELALIRSEHFAQLTGNYSRFGWDHPGPAWFYAIDPVYAILGSHSYAFYVGVLLLHALFAILIVAVMWRARGHLAAAVAAVLVLLYLVVITAHVWETIWPPFAPILPMALLFPLAAWGAVKSWPALVGALIVGSYALQSHVGTTLTVVGVWAVMVLLRFGWWRYDRRHPRPKPAGPPSLGLLSSVGVLLLILMWLPPLVDEIAGQHNLSHLATFFLTPRGQHGWHESLSVLGTLLASFTTGYVPYVLQPNWLPMPASSWVAIGAYLFFTGALLVAASALRDRFAQALALMLGLGFPVLVLSIKHVAGPVYPYFLLWTTSLSMVLALGWTALLAGQAERLNQGARRPYYGLGAAAAGVLLLLPAGLLAAQLGSGFAREPSPAVVQFDASSRTAWEITAAALQGRKAQPIVIDITEDDRIPLAGGLALQLRRQGWTIQVNQMWNYIFGPDSVPDGRARIELVLVDPKEHAKWSSLLPDMRPIGRTPDTELYLRSLYPGESP